MILPLTFWNGQKQMLDMDGKVNEKSTTTNDMRYSSYFLSVEPQSNDAFLLVSGHVAPSIFHLA
jgi:hypothetical protein